MADEFLVAVQSVLDTFESSPDTFLEVAAVDSLRLATANVEPSNQGERDIRWAESAAMRRCKNRAILGLTSRLLRGTLLCEA